MRKAGRRKNPRSQGLEAAKRRGVVKKVQGRQVSETKKKKKKKKGAENCGQAESLGVKGGTGRGCMTEALNAAKKNVEKSKATTSSEGG